LKVDRYAKDLSKRIDNFSDCNGNYDDDSYGLTKHDDEYYLDRGSEPPRYTLHITDILEQKNGGH
jgi:hypothetical protein